jgi:hypothetical protein
MTFLINAEKRFGKALNLFCVPVKEPTSKSGRIKKPLGNRIAPKGKIKKGLPKTKSKVTILERRSVHSSTN